MRLVRMCGRGRPCVKFASIGELGNDLCLVLERGEVHHDAASVSLLVVGRVRERRSARYGASSVGAVR